MIFVDDKQQEHDKSTKGHATNIRITSTTRHQKRFSTSNTKVKTRTMLPWSQKGSGQHGAYLDETLGLEVAVRRELLLRDVMSFFLYEYHRVHIYSLETWKQSKPTCPNRTLSLTQTELNLKIHGPNTHAGADSQAFFNSCFKPNLLAAH